jgi:C4-dicarboxylate transporter, DctM subunit
MDVSNIALYTLAFMFLFMMLGVPIVFSLGFSSLVAGLIAYGGSVLPKLGMASFHFMYNINWTSLPLFILLGEVMASTAMGEDLFDAGSKWLSRIPGGLVGAAVVGEAVGSAVIGTSLATIIVVGKTAIPAFEKHGYNRNMGLGALLAGGVLGPLIPPSTTMIIYGVLAEESIGQLFIAGIIPGIILTLMLIVPVILWCWWKPKYGPSGQSYTWKEKFRSIRNIWPTILVILAILGTIYFGIATPTESAGVGTFIMVILAMAFYRMRWKGLKKALIEATLVNAMIMFLCLSAYFFTYLIGSSNIATKIGDLVAWMHLPPLGIILMINVILIILGGFIDPITITLLTVPIFIPLIVQAGYDPLWFGVVFTVNTEIGLLYPPIGENIFAVKSVFKTKTSDLFKAIAPFLAIETVFLLVIILWPGLSLWLPAHMIGG